MIPSQYIEFFMNVLPQKTTSQAGGKRLFVLKGKPIFFKDKAVQQLEKQYEDIMEEYKPEFPLVGALTLLVDFTFAYRKSEPLRNRNQPIPMTVRPDCSNLIKLVEDCLGRAGFYGDDSQITCLRVTKCWGHNPGINITLFHNQY